MIVAILHGSNDVYGASRVLLDEVDALRSLGHEVRVVLPVEGPLTSELEGRGATVSVDRNLAVLRRTRLRDSIRRPSLPDAALRADLVVLWTLALVAYVPLLRLKRLPYYVSVHELLEGVFGRALVRLMVAPGNAPVAACSAAVARWLGGLGVDPERIRVVYPSFSWKVSGRRRPGTAYVVAVVGRVNGHKGHAEVVKAFKSLPEAAHGWKLLLVGAPFPGQEQARDDLEAEAKSDPRIEMRGEVAGFEDLLDNIDLIACFPTRPEPFGLVPIEAWARGMRSAGFSDGGAAEVLQLVKGVEVERSNDAVGDITAALQVAFSERDSWDRPDEDSLRAVFSAEKRAAAISEMISHFEVKNVR